MRNIAPPTVTLPRMVAVFAAAVALTAMLAVFLDLAATGDGRGDRLVLPEKTKSLIMLPHPRQ
jgi:hypothetical protein